MYVNHRTNYEKQNWYAMICGMRGIYEDSKDIQTVISFRENLTF